MNVECLLLIRYNYPFELDDSDVNDWYKELCENCPGEGGCIDEFWDRLRNATVLCPHCKATDIWEIREEDGISCRYCGMKIYHRQPEPKKKDPFDGVKRVRGLDE